jgi:hypothetical protein
MTGLDRDTAAKPVNFTKVYGGGPGRIAQDTGRTLQEAQALVAQYDERLPFVSKLARIYQRQAERTGITRLYGGALRHWTLYALPGFRGKKGSGLARRMRRDAGYATLHTPGTARTPVAPGPTRR